MAISYLDMITTVKSKAAKWMNFALSIDFTDKKFLIKKHLDSHLDSTSYLFKYPYSLGKYTYLFSSSISKQFYFIK